MMSNGFFSLFKKLQTVVHSLEWLSNLFKMVSDNNLCLIAIVLAILYNSTFYFSAAELKMKSDIIGQPKMKLVKWFRNVINNSNVAFAKHNGLIHLPSVVARFQTDHNDRFLKKHSNFILTVHRDIAKFTI